MYLLPDCCYLPDIGTKLQRRLAGYVENDADKLVVFSGSDFKAETVGEAGVPPALNGMVSHGITEPMALLNLIAMPECKLSP